VFLPIHIQGLGAPEAGCRAQASGPGPESCAAGAAEGEDASINLRECMGLKEGKTG